MKLTNPKRSVAAIILLTFYAAIPGSHADNVTDWNNAALEAIRANSTNPPQASRSLAILHASIYDAVNGIRRTHQTYFVTGTVSRNASVKAAVAAAANYTLKRLFPAQAASFKALRALQLNTIAASEDKRSGILWGRAVATELMIARSTDGSENQVAYTSGNMPGEWQPTPPGFAVPLLAYWGTVEPFAIIAGSQFRPAGPPAVTSQEYAAELNEVKNIGANNSAARTPEQTDTALFWSDGGGTVTPPGHWNQIAQAVALKKGNTLEENARLFALLNIALADAAIASWDAKYSFAFWRPITAVRNADNDGNANTAGDPTWTPLITTPPFPEYISGHSTFSAAAAAVLAGFYHKDAIGFSIGSDGLPGVTRTYHTFSQTARECGLSRIWGGIHFRSAEEDGLIVGFSIGRYVSEELLLPRNTWSSSIVAAP